MEMVPVGAMLRTVALRLGGFEVAGLDVREVPAFFRYRPGGPFSLFPYGPDDKLRQFLRALEPYLMPSFASVTASPITPSPTFLFPFTTTSICFSGYRLASITLSRNLIPASTVSFSFSISSLYPPLILTSILSRLTDPRLHASKGSRGTSPHGLVASIFPQPRGRVRPVDLVHENNSRISRHPAREHMSPAGDPASPLPDLRVPGIDQWIPRRPSEARCMKSSVTPTEMLKLDRALRSALALMNSSMSG